MRFFIDTTQSMSQSVLVKNKDNSFSCLNNELDWDFQVKIEPFVVLILNINSNSKQCIGIEGCVNLSKRIILKEIDVKHVLTGRLYMDDKSIDPDCFGKEYLIKNAKKVKGIEYYYSSQKLYGFGDIEIDLPIYQFAINQYVKIDEDGKLVAIYLKFS